MNIKVSLIPLFLYSAQTQQTKSDVEGWAEPTGSDWGPRNAPDAERSTKLPTEPSLSARKFTAGRYIPHPAQKQSCQYSKCDKWKVLGIPSVFESVRLLSEYCNWWTSAFLPCHRSSEAPVPVFLAEPAAVVFTDYTVGQVYEVGLSSHEGKSFIKVKSRGQIVHEELPKTYCV